MFQPKIKVFLFIVLFLLPLFHCKAQNSKTESDTKQKSSAIDIDFEKWTLKNGLDVIFHVDKSLPVVHVNIWYHVGGKNDPQNISGFAHLFEHMMFQGSKNAPEEFLDYLNNLGASGSNASTTVDRTNYYTTIPSENLEKLLWLESDRMGFMPEALDEKQFLNQKDVVANEKKQRDNHPYSDTKYIVANTLYPLNHPYHRTVIGDMKELKNSSLDDVKSFYTRYYSPNNATLTLAGNFEPQQAKEWIQKYFGSLKPSEKIIKVKKWIPTLEHSQEIVIEKKIPLEVLIWVWPAPYNFHEDTTALDFATLILASDETSRLYQKLVHETGLATEVFIDQASDEVSGTVELAVVLRPGSQKEKVKQIVKEILDEFAKTGPTPNELQKIKAQFEYGFLTGLETPKGKAEFLNSLNTFLDDPHYYKTYYKTFQNTKALDVKNAFSKWIHNKNNLLISYVSHQNLQAQKTKLDRATAPKPNGEFSFEAPKVEKATLENGLEIYVSHQPSLPKVLVSLNTKSGNVLESSEKSGAAYLMGSAIERGTKDWTFLKLKTEFAKYGSSFSTSGNKYNASADLNTLKKHLPQTFELFANIIKNPEFSNEEIERLKKQRSDYIDYNNSKTTSVAQNIFMQKVFGKNHPAGLKEKGTKTSLAKITRDDILTEYQNYWVPNNAYLLFVGDITLDQAKSLTQNHLSTWQKKDLPELNFDLPPLHKKHKIYLVDFPNSAQTAIHVGFATPKRKNLNDSYYALFLANEILGGGMAARLFKNLREDKGYTYGAYSSFSSGKHFGVFTAFSNVQTNKTFESLLEIKKEIEELKSSVPPSLKETSVVKQSAISSYILGFQNLSGIRNSINTFLYNEMHLDALAKTPQKFQNQDLQTIKDSFEKIVPKTGWTIVMAGDLKKIQPKLKNLNWADVIIVNKNGDVISE